MNLNDILQSPQGSAALNGLAARMGLTPEQAQAAAQSLIPALSAGLQRAAQNPGSLGKILGHLTDTAHQENYETGAAPPSPEAITAGKDAAGTILGNSRVAEQIEERAAAATGLSPDVIKSMLPEITSVVLGGVTSHMQQGGMGGMLGQLAQAAQSGGLSNILGGLLGGGQSASAPASGGGLGGMLGGLLGSILGGNKTAGAPGAGGIDPAMVKAGMDMLGKMFQPGTPVSGDVQAEIGQIFSKHA